MAGCCDHIERLDGVVLLVVALWRTTAGLEFADGDKKPSYLSMVSGTFLWSPVVRGFGLDHFEPFAVDVVRDTYNWSGRGVLLGSLSNGKSPESNIRNVLKEGARKGYKPPTAIFIWGGMPYAGFATYARDNSNMDMVKMPVLEVSTPFWVLVTIVNNATAGADPLPISILIRDDDKSPMMVDWPFGYVVLCGVIMTALCVACFVVNIYKFQLHIRITDGFTIPKLYFVIDIIANFMRFWYVCINPFFVNQFAYTWTTICTTTHMALTIICTLLLSLKWQELLQRTTLRATMFLSRFKWPFIIASIIIFAVEFVSSTLRGLWYSTKDLPVISWSFLSAAGFIVCVLLFVSGTQILVQISKVIAPFSRRVWQLHRATILILASGIFLLAWCVCELAFLIRVYKLQKYSLAATNLITTLQFTFLCSCSLLQNWAMPIPSLGYTPPNAPTPSSAALMDSAGTYTRVGATVSGKESVPAPESMVSLGSTWSPASAASLSNTDASTSSSHSSGNLGQNDGDDYDDDDLFSSGISGTSQPGYSGDDVYESEFTNTY